MAEELDFSIPSRDKRSDQSRSRLLPVLVLVVLIAVLANIGLLLLQKDSRERGPTRGLAVDKLKHLALKLEKQGLNTASVSAWKEYLDAASADDQEAARIWYRIGKSYQTAGRYEMALESFYRSESFSKIDDISSEISRRIQECLEAMGKFAALRYELADRVGADSTSADGNVGQETDPVVAEIGSQKIMKSDLDRRIEQQIERQIAQIAAYLPEDQVKKKKEEMLNQYSTDSKRQFFLNQYLVEEVLYRKARESRLTDDADVKAALKDLERSFLAAKVMEKEFADEIKITQGDLETYFEAHKQEYVQPQRARVSHILVQDKQNAKIVRERLEKGESFAKVAEDMSQDDLTRQKGGELAEWIEKSENGAVPGIGNTTDAMRVIFSTDKGKVASEDLESDDGIHIIKVLDREPERQKNFDQAANEVFIALRSRKEREVQQKLLAGLKEHYDVVIHHSAFAEKDKSEKNQNAGQK